MLASTPRGLAAGALATGLVALPAPAHAATLTPAQPCVLQATPLAASVSGLAPGTAVRVGFRNDATSPTVAADATGTASAAGIAAPVALADLQRHSTERFPLSAWTADGATLLAQVPMVVAQPNVFLLPSLADVSRRRTIVAAGLTPGQPAYVHVRIGGRWRRTTALGPAGPGCGQVRVRTAFLRGIRPLPRFGTADVYVDGQRRPSAATRPQGRLQLRLRRRVVRLKPNYYTETITKTWLTAASPVR